MVWVDADSGYPAVEYETFKRVVTETGTLHKAVTQLLTFAWLHVENHDFVFRYHVARANGISIESEKFVPAETLP